MASMFGGGTLGAAPQGVPLAMAPNETQPYQQPAPQQTGPGAQRTLLDSLAEQEGKMDSRVLHVNALGSALPPGSPSSGMSDADLKQERFRKTVMAAHEIVTQKLYKAKAPSLEAYFKSIWKISRAQVYRFLDCATVLSHLEDFPQVPSHERLCRSLKRFAFSNAGGASPMAGTPRPSSPTNEQSIADLRTLWTRVLERSHGNNELITSTFVGKVWEELIRMGQVSRTGAVGTGEGTRGGKRATGRKPVKGKKRGGRRRDSDEDDEQDEEEEDFEGDEEELPFGMDAEAGSTAGSTGRQPSLGRTSSQKRTGSSRPSSLKAVARNSGNGNAAWTDDGQLRPHSSFSDEELNPADSDGEQDDIRNGGRGAGSSHIGSMERESWAALMARSNAAHSHHPLSQMQLHSRESSRFGAYGEEEDPAMRASRAQQGPWYPPAGTAPFQHHHASGLHRSQSYSVNGMQPPTHGGGMHRKTPSGHRMSSVLSSPGLQPSSAYPRLQRPSSADPETDSRRAMAGISSGGSGFPGPIQHASSFSSDGNGPTATRPVQGYAGNPAVRYGSSPSSAQTGSWHYPSPLHQIDTHGHRVPAYQQHQPGMSPGMYPQMPPINTQPPRGTTLPYPHYSLSDDEDDRGQRQGRLKVQGQGQRDPSRSPQPPPADGLQPYHHQPVPRRHNPAGSHGSGHHPHSFSPYNRPESPRLGPSARYPSPSPNHHNSRGSESPAMLAGRGHHGSLHIPELNLGSGQHGYQGPGLAVQQPPRQVPTPVSSTHSPALRANSGGSEHAYYDTAVVVQSLRADSPEPTDAMTLDDLANIALMRRMSVKNDMEIEDRGQEAVSMEGDAGRDGKGALGFILN